MTTAGFVVGSALAVPLALLVACLLSRPRELMPGLLPLAPLPAIAAALLAADTPPLVIGGSRYALVLQLDFPGAILLGTAALLWSLAALYGRTYLRGTANAGRFAVCWLMTLTGCLGVFLAADMVGFYLLLGLLSIGACGLVIHDETPRAWRSGGLYVGLALFGESCALLGFVLLAAGSPGESLLIRDAVAALPGSPWRDATLALLIVGLGLKAGLVPLHVWMPLAHAAAPVPASAVLSGAVVKVGIIGLIRFLPLDTAMDGLGQALAAAGLATAFYGVAIGILQGHPKAVLAYSSVSQMGVIVAVLGMGLSVGDASTGLSAAYYASHHVLVKGTMFLAVGVVAATGGRRLGPILLLVAVLGVGLGGLPLTGGALAKYAVKGPLGDGLAGTLAKVSAAGTTLLMLHFVFRLRSFAARDPAAAASPGLLWPWLALALASFVVPWMLYLTVPGGTVGYMLQPSVLWAALVPVLGGGVAAVAHRYWGGRWLPKVPEGDIAVLVDGALKRAVAAGPRVDRLDHLLLRWRVAGILLLVGMFALGLAAMTGH
jgi:formate hydrogenlyase subunit 3/multisubunit Na+/H+ antiporter MnhD subunit